jgi:hypothetical protein
MVDLRKASTDGRGSQTRAGTIHSSDGWAKGGQRILPTLEHANELSARALEPQPER